MTPSRRRALAAALLLPWLFGARAQTARAAPAPAAERACALCRDRLQTVPALRAQLPGSWRLQLEREPVLGGEMLVVEAGAPQAPPLLLVHGLGQNGFTDWVPVMQTLARRWRVIAIDLPGFGYSSAPQAKLAPTPYARVLERLLARLRIAALPVVGHSMGGAVALRLAADFPGCVTRLVLVDVAGILHRTAFGKHATIGQLPSEGWPQVLQEQTARLRDLGHIIVERVFGLPDPTAVLRANEWLWPLLLRDRSSVNAALALMEEDFGSALYTLRVPAQVIWGDADKVAPLRTGELLARRLPQAQLHVLRGVGHTPMLQATAEFGALLQRVLHELPNPPAAPPPAEAPLQDLQCTGEVGRRLSGRCRTLRVERCTALQIVDLVAERIELRDSIVEMTGVQVRGGDPALEIVNSELVATACDFEGRQAIRSDAARLDLAGCRLEAQAFAVQALRRSRLVASVCQLRDAMYSGGWHDDRELQSALLDPGTPGQVTNPLPDLPLPPLPGGGR
ncbi:MAG: hypothetical protein ABS84_15115 [Rubrivivax sp. SCN 71-131]|nr:MAG: hypothetical protein ABS84_15115 [Rubrivivax sp. SCN 71-131]